MGDLVKWLRTAASAIYIEVPAAVADDISPRLKEAADRIEADSARIAELEAEVEEARTILAHTDLGSLPNDWTLKAVAEARLDDLTKLRDQVRNTCRRAEKAEAEVASYRVGADRVSARSFAAERARAERAEAEKAELEAEVERLRYVVEAARPFPKLLRGVRDSDIRDAVTTLYDRLTLSEKELGDADT